MLICLHYFCSSNDPRAHFGFGSISDKVNIEIVWPDGLIENISGVDINQFITIQLCKSIIYNNTNTPAWKIEIQYGCYFCLEPVKSNISVSETS